MQERIVNILIQCMIDLDMEAFEEVLDNFITAKGIEKQSLKSYFHFSKK
ncbi:MAG: hypothetical protein IPP81_01720 [Chitinophagaceae bacterium]|nr:hypothetical protein [Chitinophagaceae bacterium]